VKRGKGENQHPADLAEHDMQGTVEQSTIEQGITEKYPSESTLTAKVPRVQNDVAQVPAGITSAAELPDETVRQLRGQLLAWYRQNRRPMPWRERQDAYGIWVSEIMLQQTQVDTVIPYYRAFMARFPTVADLAGAEEEAVLEMWAGLGYYSRARNLQRAARIVAGEYGGSFPEDIRLLRRLPGIGDYTAGAVASIAFGQPAAAVDGNVIRVFSRLFLIREDVARPETKKRLAEIGHRLVDPEAPGDFNQGLMELGAMVCTPKQPACESCPLCLLCRGAAAGEQQLLPQKAKKPAPATITMEAALVCHGDRFLLVKRPGKGLLANLWALPAAEAGEDPGAAVRAALIVDSTSTLSAPQWVREEEHIFTHVRWRMRLYRMTTAERTADDSRQRWVSLEEAATMALPTAFRKLLPATGEAVGEATLESTGEAVGKATLESTAEAVREAALESTAEAVREAALESTAEAVGEATLKSTAEAVREATGMMGEGISPK